MEKGDFFWSHVWPVLLGALCSLPFLLEGGDARWLVAVLLGAWVLWRVGGRKV